MKRPKITTYDFRDKFRNTQNTVFNTLNKLMSVYEYKNVPETFSIRNFELYLHVYGFAIVTEAKPRNAEKGLYAFNGGLGGEPDVYHFPTLAIVANPALEQSMELKIGKECVVVKNDSLLQGTLPIIEKYSTLLSEAELSMYIKIISARTSTLISASDTRTIQSAKDYLTELEMGKLGVIADNAFLESLKTQPYASSGSGAENLTDLIEIRQYLRACLNNDLGLPSNYNLKRERINTTESQFDYEALKPFIDDMTKWRKKGLEEINSLFGTDIEVELSSSWEQVQKLRPEQIEAKDGNNPNTAEETEIEEDNNEQVYITETDEDKEEQDESKNEQTSNDEEQTTEDESKEEQDEGKNEQTSNDEEQTTEDESKEEQDEGKEEQDESDEEQTEEDENKEDEKEDEKRESD